MYGEFVLLTTSQNIKTLRNTGIIVTWLVVFMIMFLITTQLNVFFVS